MIPALWPALRAFVTSVGRKLEGPYLATASELRTSGGRRRWPPSSQSVSRADGRRGRPRVAARAAGSRGRSAGRSGVDEGARAGATAVRRTVAVRSESAAPGGTRAGHDRQRLIAN